MISMRKKKVGLLAADKNYVPAAKDEGDELYPNGIFEFNITKMIEYIRVRQAEIPLEYVEIKSCTRSFSKLNETTIDKADITVPLILAEISPERYNVIDGNHRLEKAYRMGVEHVAAYKLKPQQHMLFLTSLKAYHAYIEYWNSKVKDMKASNYLSSTRKRHLTTGHNMQPDQYRKQSDIPKGEPSAVTDHVEKRRQICKDRDREISWQE